MKNLAGDKDCNLTIMDELYLAGIPMVKEIGEEKVPYYYIGKLGEWTFKRRSCYWSASVEKTEDGLILEKAMELYRKKYPNRDEILGKTIRAGGDGNGLSPDDYVSSPVYGDSLDEKLVAIGYKKEYSDLLKREYVSINRGEMAEICNSGILKVDRFVDCYHIDELVSLKEFADFIKNIENEK